MPNQVLYTVWDAETGEIYSHGKTFGRVIVPEGHKVTYGHEFKRETHIVNPTTGVGVERGAPPLKSQDELQALINKERERRIAVGKVIAGVHVTGSERDRANLSDLAFAAQLRLASGDTTTATPFRDGTNVVHDLVPMQMIDLWQQSASYVSEIYAASWALKAMEPIPQDVESDENWP